MDHLVLWEKRSSNVQWRTCKIILRNKETDRPSDIVTMFALFTESNKCLKLLRNDDYTSIFSRILFDKINSIRDSKIDGPHGGDFCAPCSS